MTRPVLTFLLASLSGLALAAAACYSGDCGYKGACINGTCQCPVGYTLHSNGNDCRNTTCGGEDCLECTADLRCSRCAYFLEESTRECLATCTGEAKVVLDGVLLGSICVVSQEEEDDNRDLIIGVVVGVSCGIFICIVVAIAVCVHFRRTRRNVNLKQTQYPSEDMQVGNVKKVPLYDNKGFEPDLMLSPHQVDRDVYMAELEKLKLHAPTLLTMLNEIRQKLRDMDKADPRVPTYKGVVHQLCRVLVLVHKKDPLLSIPSDALGLMEWAHQMIEDRQMDSQQSEDSSGPPVNKISYVEVPEGQQSSNPYATPSVQPSNPKYASLTKRSSQSQLVSGNFYSSVPVPVSANDISTESVAHISASQNNTLKREYDIPWDLKWQDSLTTLNCSGSDLTMGYFANGRFYDPTPVYQTPKKEAQKEVYAPLSSYSERNNPVFSTFGERSGSARMANPNFPQSLSSHSSMASNVDEDEDNEEGFPFDMREATEAVEV